MQTDGLNVAIATRGIFPTSPLIICLGAIDAFCMSLRFEYQTLALEVFDFFASMTNFA